jgi:hypothetical protein
MIRFIFVQVLLNKEFIYKGHLSMAVCNATLNAQPDAKITHSLRFALKTFNTSTDITSMIITTMICPASNPTLNPNKPQPKL